MNIAEGTWINMPFGTRIDDISDYELAVMQAAEISRRIVVVWSKEDKYRTASDYQLMSWANRCAND